jgi:hypothetical protein
MNLASNVQPNHLARALRRACLTQVSSSIFRDDHVASSKATALPLVCVEGKTSLEREILGHHAPVKEYMNIPIPPLEELIDIPL